MTDYMNIKDKTKTQLSGYKAEFINWGERSTYGPLVLLGVWIGDGLESGSTIASNDIEVKKKEYILNWCIKTTVNSYIRQICLGLEEKPNIWKKGAMGSGSCDSYKESLQKLE